LRKKEGRSHVAIWNWVQRFDPTIMYTLEKEE
jgi:hypothetical protein